MIVLFFDLFSCVQILPLVCNLFGKANLTVQSDCATVIQHKVAIEATKYLVLIGCQNTKVGVVGPVDDWFECKVDFAIVGKDFPIGHEEIGRAHV